MLQEASRSPQVWLTGTELDKDIPPSPLNPLPPPHGQGWKRSSKMGVGRAVRESFLEKALKDE